MRKNIFRTYRLTIYFYFIFNLKILQKYKNNINKLH
jgi:hypothetical protein